MNASKPYILTAVVIFIAGTIYFINGNNLPRIASNEVITVAPRTSSENAMKKEEKSKRYELAKEIVAPAGFINTPSTHSTDSTTSTSSGQASSLQATPITISGLIGKKVILVDFWTYSCINCQRTTPYLNAWYEKYRDQGLEIIGMHTPEFEFESRYDNVVKAVEKFGIKYPVVLDNEYGTWQAYRNQYWPRKYLIDIDGYIVYDHIGEGGYEETEKKIQELLDERTAVLGGGMALADSVVVQSDKEILADFSRPFSPEIYFGASRNERLGNGQSRQLGQQKFSLPTNIETNVLYLSGDWDLNPEFSENITGDARIVFRYQAKEVYFVANAVNPVEVIIKRDGQLLNQGAGEDVDAGQAVIDDDRLYNLINDSEYGEHTLEIIIKNPGLRAFTFTFG